MGEIDLEKEIRKLHLLKHLYSELKEYYEKDFLDRDEYYKMKNEIEHKIRRILRKILESE